MQTLKFEELSLSKETQKAIAEMGFEEATPIQSAAIPFILEGRDVIGQAQTGTGKTASFGIPIAEFIDAHSKKTQALVLCPTRELAIQVAEEMAKLIKYKKGIHILPIYGGQSIERQIRSLKAGVQIIIATPGRMIDHINRKTADLSHVKMIVLDEADEMLNMGFRDDIEEILKSIPEERQTIFFSATMPPPIMQLTKKYQQEPELVKVVHKELTVPNINQYFYELRNSMKLEVLTRLLDIHNPVLSLVFCNTKRAVDELVSHLQARGYAAEGLHGDMKQLFRDRVMAKFRSGKIEILVATDVAARGIDVDDIDAVFNYDMPQDEEYYVHRIGRTARAGRKGQAFTFISGKEFYKLRDIERYTKTKIVKQDIPTISDVKEIRDTQMITEIKESIEEIRQDASKVRPLIEKLMNDEYDTIDIASGVLNMILKTQTELPEKDELKNFSSRDERGEGRRGGDRRDDRRDGKRGDRRDGKRGDKRDRNENRGNREGGNYSDRDERRDRRGDRGRDRDRGGDYSRGSSSGNMVRLFFNGGKKDKIQPKDIVGAIAGETTVPAKAIGEISMLDSFSFIEIEKKYSRDVIEQMNNKRIKGVNVNLEVAKPKR
ncbi:MAG: DEAD/DEAH box helicase [Ignavibacteria bacterium]|nr:DEAD/DEAH box helicase [Ignavibacteria bacterium]